jgi:hypothetical protein
MFFFFKKREKYADYRLNTLLYCTPTTTDISHELELNFFSFQRALLFLILDTIESEILVKKNFFVLKKIHWHQIIPVYRIYRIILMYFRLRLEENDTAPTASPWLKLCRAKFKYINKIPAPAL